MCLLYIIYSDIAWNITQNSHRLRQRIDFLFNPRCAQRKGLESRVSLAYTVEKSTKGARI